MRGCCCCTDSYVFDATSLKLLKHFYAHLHSLSTLCESNYAPTFSRCSSRMCMLSEETNGESHLIITVYQLPDPFELQQKCRRAIVKCLKSMADVEALPLPPKLKRFLRFAPQAP
jgi:hypothetical protein